MNLKKINNILGEMKSALKEAKVYYTPSRNFFTVSTDGGFSPVHLFIPLDGEMGSAKKFNYYNFSPSKYKGIAKDLRSYEYDFQENFNDFHNGLARDKYSSKEILNIIDKLNDEPEFRKVYKMKPLSRGQVFKILLTDLKVPKNYLEKKIGEVPSEGISNFKIGNSEVIIPDSLPEKKIPEMKKLLEKVYAQFKKAGIPQLMTGAVKFSKIGGRTLGYYEIANKEIMIGYNAKLDKVTLHTIFHEYGHKWYHEFINNKISDIRNKYNELRYKKRERFDNSDAQKIWDKYTKDFLNVLKVGDEFSYEGRKRKMKGDWVVDSIQGASIKLRRPDSNRVSVGLTPLWFMDNKVKFKNNDKANKLTGIVMVPDDNNPSDDWFPTKYSESNDSEWFADLFAFYMMGRLKGEPEKFIKSMLK